MPDPGLMAVLGYAFRWCDNIGKWFQKKGKRDAVQGMEKDVLSDNDSGINKRMSTLARKAKNKRDSV